MKRLVLAFGLVFFWINAAFAQGGDAPSCSDPAMFPKRIPNYLIASCKTANDVQLFRWPGGQQEVMGIRSEVVYKVPSPEFGATPKYIVSNYTNAVRGIGGEILDDPARSTLGDRLTARLQIENRQVWVHVTSDSPVIEHADSVTHTERTPVNSPCRCGLFVPAHRLAAFTHDCSVGHEPELCTSYRQYITPEVK